jgi:hypothetical protein
MSNFEPWDLVMVAGGKDSPGGEKDELYVIQKKKPDCELYYSISLSRPQMALLDIYGPNARKLCSLKEVPDIARALYRYKEIADAGKVPRVPSAQCSQHSSLWLTN